MPARSGPAAARGGGSPPAAAPAAGSGGRSPPAARPRSPPRRPPDRRPAAPRRPAPRARSRARRPAAPSRVRASRAAGRLEDLPVHPLRLRQRGDRVGEHPVGRISGPARHGVLTLPRSNAAAGHGGGVAGSVRTSPRGYPRSGAEGKARDARLRCDHACVAACSRRKRGRSPANGPFSPHRPAPRTRRTGRPSVYLDFETGHHLGLAQDGATGARAAQGRRLVARAERDAAGVAAAARQAGRRKVSAEVVTAPPARGARPSACATAAAAARIRARAKVLVMADTPVG